MASSIFLTGASGFLGSRVLARLSADPNRTIVCLIRGNPITGQPGNVQFVRGDLLDPRTYMQALAGCDTVLHLAAVTGKQPPTEYLRVNRDGTDALARAARSAGVTRFLYVSSIAAKFRDQSNYFYAQSKLQAEEVVAQSGLQFTIVRPTIIFGQDSPALQGLSRLASLPVMLIFGDGGVLVQPVLVDDLAGCLVAMIGLDGFGGQTVEIGGPEVLSMEELLLRIRRAGGRGKAPVLHLPARPIAVFLSRVEPLLRPLLPVTAGQLAAFTNDGTVTAHPWVKEQESRMTGVDQMLRLGSNRMDPLEQECRTYSKYLIGQAPTGYIIEKYRDFHNQSETLPKLDRFDRFLVATSARSPLWTRLADSYASLSRKDSAVRKKLILLLALLECTAPSYESVDRVPAGGPIGAFLRLFGEGMRYAFMVAVASMMFTSIRLWMTPRER